MEGEAHAGEARAAVVRREAGIGAGPVDDGVQLRLHARHGVDLAGESRNVEGVHHRRRGDAEIDRLVDGRRQFVDGGNAQVRIDEEPLPIERDDLHSDRLVLLRDGLSRLDAIDPAIRIEQMRAQPGQGAQADDDEKGRRPDQQFELGRVIPIGRVGRGCVRLPVAPCEEDSQRHHGYDDDQHQAGRDDEQVTLLGRDVAGRRKDDEIAAAQQPDQRKQKQGSKSSHRTLPLVAGRIVGSMHCCSAVSCLRAKLGGRAATLDNLSNAHAAPVRQSVQCTIRSRRPRAAGEPFLL